MPVLGQLADSCWSKPALLTSVEMPSWSVLSCLIFSDPPAQPVSVPVISWYGSPDRYSCLSGSWIGNSQLSPGRTTTSKITLWNRTFQASPVFLHPQHGHWGVSVQHCHSARLPPPRLNVHNWMREYGTGCLKMGRRECEVEQTVKDDLNWGSNTPDTPVLNVFET